MMKIVISIPVHEKPEVINNQIENILKYIENVSIVLHVSKGFFENYNIDDIHKFSNLYINPIHLNTQWASIVETHIVNFEYISQKIDFDYFVLHASNDMYIKKGFEKYVGKYEAGFNIRKVINKNSHWWPGNNALKDKQLKRIMDQCGQTVVIASQVESSFYKKEHMKKIVDIIKSNYVKDKEEILYPREEIYFSTVASSFISWDKVGNITTFSEVHRFDRMLWKIRNITRKIYYQYGLRLFVSEDRYYKFEAFYNDCLFKTKFYKTTKKIVNKILKDDLNYLKSNSFLDDGSGRFRLYDENVFSVKRVNREIDDSLRKYITSL